MAVFTGSNVNYPEAVFHYIPSKAAAIVAAIIFLCVTAVILVRLFKRRNFWGLCLPIGTLCYAIGYIFRVVLAKKQTSKAIFIVEEIFVIVSPAAFLAFNYVVYGRMIRTAVGQRKGFTLVRPSWVSVIFVASDIITFLMQAGGAGLEASVNKIKEGRNLLLAGLIAQTVSYLFFTLLVAFSHWRITKSTLDTTVFPWFLFYIVYFSSVFILLRGCFRIAIFAQSSGSYLDTHEYIFYILDALPLLFATSVYAIWWPGNYFDRLPLQEGYAKGLPMH